MTLNLPIRMRRNRSSESLRRLTQENWLSQNDLILPLFVLEKSEKTTPIKTLPGISRLGRDDLFSTCEMALQLGIPAVALFPVVSESKKTSLAEEALNPDGLVPEVVRSLKTRFPELSIITDIALDPFSSDGHDGLVVGDKIVNDETVTILSKMALVHAQAGADIVAPSDMMDGRIGAIRSALDKAGYLDTGIMAYSAKYASALYGPFRDALASQPKSGDKKTYQMSPANRREAIMEAKLDLIEGADSVMVKPGTFYLDIIRDLRNVVNRPIAAYHVSGEYAMLKFAAEAGAIQYEATLLEALLSFKRAGADMILTYGALDAARLLARSK